MARLMPDPLILAGEGWADYGLVDSGHGRKLERYGDWRFIRPEPQAMWSPRLEQWDAHGEFVPGSDEDGGGRWVFDQPVPRELRLDLSLPSPRRRWLPGFCLAAPSTT